ncbi:putative SWI/SNF-related matrix-associated actin-dependent regulator of chromatin subfamily A member 3-like 1 [Madurella mycetomatis]|uniref:SWI/SNF-related matrix-associated actin-dependent regulator of chromatin subfamily A member 3-like 1 n=1 Tax=Madurella mycetomatis TaxID=100816 RepID=A0A175WE68_9PEZI|nr:putative SWI/SNF-related matrix-associated actin-dependent regulator of chromatin subfamily A member 3-like 1 [Madurella mycetomatis]
MPRQAKRSRVAAGLSTDEAGSARPTKSARYPASSYASQPSAYGSSQPSSIAASSQPSSSAAVQASPDAVQRLSWQTPGDDDGEPCTQDLTQSDDGPAHEFYGSLESKIVGVRYYNGMATAGEVVVCRREPSNPYDSNAIRVDNVLGHQIGHIPRTVAAKLAGYIDPGDITIEAMLTGEKGFYECPVRIYIYGTANALGRANLEERLKKDRLVNATQLKQTRKENDQQRRAMGLKSGRGTAGLATGEPEISLEQLAQTSQAVNFRVGGDIVQTLAMDEDQLSRMPEADQPDTLRATLLPYQLQGLAWLTAKESPAFPKPGASNSIQLWKRDARGRYINTATNFTVASAPSLLSGGILADDMGLGKTLQIISLIMTGGPGSTLIVAPVGVMSNWEQQIRRHVSEEHAPKVLIYHGNSRQTAAKSLNDYGVVITSYGTLSSEANGGVVSKVQWRRVVLDEGHTIRNAKTKAAEAACKLNAQSRWVLTGTPIINNIRDLHSLLKFLRITGGIEQLDIFNTVIARPLAAGEPRAEAILQSLMGDLCLRRTKDMKFVDLKLPPKTEYIHRITFWPDEKKKYEALLSEAQGALEEFQSRSKTGQKGRFQGVLERLLRLRQTCASFLPLRHQLADKRRCNHWTLCKDRITDLLKLLEEQDVVPLNTKNRALLQQALQLVIESQEDCPVCIEPMTKPVITHCKHVFCRACISRVIEIQHKCPMCRAELSDDKLVEPAPEHSAEEEKEELDTETKSSKTEALLKILQATLKNDRSKVIIFSQWTSFLTVIQHQLNEAGYTFTRVDGSMNTAQRDAAIQALDHDPNTRIMLASLSVCSVGLNLVSADTVVLADSWWAPAIEDQAVDRVHRLGQTRPTTVWRLVMEGTVEERVLDIQAEKRELVNKAFREKSGKQKKTKETRMADVLKLLA